MNDRTTSSVQIRNGRTMAHNSIHRIEEELHHGFDARDELGLIRGTILVNFGPEGRHRDLAAVEDEGSPCSLMLEVFRQLAARKFEAVNAL
jgi:hypothetical protein